MPTYEYECPACTRVFEVRQRISEPALETCDRCGGPVRRLLAPAAFILKGGGWYTTDYPSEARKKAMKEEGASPSGATTAGADTKPSTPASAEPSSSSDKSKGAGQSGKGDG